MNTFYALLDQLTLGLDTQVYNLDQTSELLCRHIQEKLGCTQVNVWLVEDRPDGALLRHQVGYDGVADRVLNNWSAGHHPNLAPYVASMTQGGLFVSDDVMSDERVAALRDSVFAPLNVRSVLCATIGANGSMTSVLACAELGQPRHWAPAEARRLKAYADAISLRRASRRRRAADAKTLTEHLLQTEPMRLSLPDEG